MLDIGRKLRYLPVSLCRVDSWWKETAEMCRGEGRSRWLQYLHIPEDKHRNVQEVLAPCVWL